MYETFEHTADVGLRMRAASQPELFAEAGRALMSVLVEDPAAGEAEESEALSLEAEGPAELLFDWLSELLYLFATRRLVARELDVDVDGNTLRATVRGWRFDPERHGGGNEVKAITYHGLKAEERDGEWRAEVILDI